MFHVILPATTNFYLTLSDPDMAKFSGKIFCFFFCGRYRNDVVPFAFSFVSPFKMNGRVFIFVLLAIAGALAIRVRPNSDAADPLNNTPIIGILTQPYSGETPSGVSRDGLTYIAASYVKFVESGGARVVPILYVKDDNIPRYIRS